MVVWKTQLALIVSFQTPVTDSCFRKWLSRSTGLALQTEHWEFKLGIMETAYNSLKSLSFKLISLYYREFSLFLRVFLIDGHKTVIKALKTELMGCYLIDCINLGVNRKCINTLASTAILNLCVNESLGLTKVILYLVFFIFQTLRFLLAQQNHMLQLFCLVRQQREMSQN